MRTLATLIVLVGALTAPATEAAPGAAAYLGAWRIDSAVRAPWADPTRGPAATDGPALVGKVVRLTPRAIEGPGVFHCRGPHYKLTSYGPDMIFEGALGEIQDRNPRETAAALAHQLGFRSAAIQTLETGCEIDFHFAGPGEARVGLNDYVYTLRQR
jgi:hypothetical protein